MTERPLRAVPIVPLVLLRGIVIPAALTDGPLRAVGIVVITAVRSAADRGLRVEPGKSKDAERERQGD